MGIRDVETVGRDGKSPQIYLMTPPPLWLDGIYGMSKPVINEYLPKIVPKLAATNGAKVIDVYKGMGGVADWRGVFPKDPPGCVTGAVNSSYTPCQWFCDKQSCNQCHPNDYGYSHLASIVKAGL